MNRIVCLLTIAVLAQRAVAQPSDPASPDPVAPAADAPIAPPAPTPAPVTTTAPAATAWAAAAADEETSDSLQIHGWVSQGAMLSTGNDYLAHTKRGSFEFFEAGLNVTKELGSNLRAGVQLFAQ